MLVQFWVYKSVCINTTGGPNAFQNGPNIVSSFFPKIFRCDITKMHLYHQNLSLNEYEFLTSSHGFEKLSQSSVSIKYPNGSLIPVDKVFQNLTKMKEFIMWYHNESPFFLPDTVKSLCQHLVKCPNLRTFHLYRLPEVPNICQISDFLKIRSNINITLHFGTSISDEYKKVLGKFIKEIIKNPPSNIPLILYHGHNEDDLTQLLNLQQPNQE
uniref:Uncharacterized protein n=1 Tax=Panagrolaimus sp. ES5 TaxID=591445 RepID=A0AC34GCD9_9BILA